MTLLMNYARHVIWNVHFVFFQTGIALNRDSGVSSYNNSISHLHPMSSSEQCLAGECLLLESFLCHVDALQN